MEARRAAPLNRTIALDTRATRVMPSMPAAVSARAPMTAPRAAPFAPAPVPAHVPAAAPAMKACAPTKDARLVMIADPDGAQATGFRVLRDALLGKGFPPVLAVTSARPGEGKTTCALNLALALAEQRMGKVLLVDGTFAAPAIGKILGVDRSAPAQAPPFTLSYMTSFLHVATSAPKAFVDAATLARSLHSFHRGGYRHVIVDAPAVDGASMILQVTAKALLVVRAGRTKARELRRAVDAIGPRKSLGVTLMGA
jgi:Mrp family chromosome partitioning ATPase